MSSPVRLDERILHYLAGVSYTDERLRGFVEVISVGNNPLPVAHRAMAADDRLMVILGLALSNSLVALSGALLAQYQGFADVQMGIGMVVWGLASVIIGEALVGTRQLGYAIAGALMGSTERVRAAKKTLDHLGGSLDPHACFLLQRGLRRSSRGPESSVRIRWALPMR